MKKTIVFLLMSFYLNTIAQCVQPTIPIVSASPNSICFSFQTTTVTLSIVSGTLNNATNWHWYAGSCGGTPIGTGTSINVSPFSSTNYYVRGEGGCVTPASCASLVVTVHPPSSSNLNSQSPLCFGQANGSATLTGFSGPPYTYSWLPSGSTNSSIYGLSAGTYTGIITNVYGCSDSTIFIINQPNPIALNVTPQQIICYGNMAAVWAQASGGTSPYTYTLTNLTTNSPTTITTPNGINAITPHLTSAVQYTTSVLDVNGCAFGPMTITVNVKPPLLAFGYLVNACDRDSIVLNPIITSTGNGGPYSYIWSNGANTSSIGVVSSLTNSPTSYTVNISDACTIPGAAAAFLVNVSPCVGMKENKNSDISISFYPNPVNDILVIENEEVLEVKLFSVLGEEILLTEITGTKNKIDVSALSNGLYYLSIFNVVNKKMMTEKILIQH